VIVTSLPETPGNVRLDAAGPAPRWVCLARRGMLHSECEAVDGVLLPAGARLDRRGRDGVGDVWFVVSGTLRTDGGARLRPGHLLVVPPDDTATGFTAVTPARLLSLSVLPDATVAALAPRRPDLLDTPR
jgi:hypothetical protein